MYEGRLIPVPDMPASYLPHLFWLKLPETMLALGITGGLGAFAAAGRHSVGLNRRACLLVVALAAVLPVGVAIVMHPALYNGLRHFIFVVPPFAVLGGLSAAWLIERAARLRTSYRRPAFGILATTFAVGIALPVIDMVRLHPYEYTAFNWASGGVRMAHDKYMLDYWGLAFKQASEELRARQRRSPAQGPAMGGRDLRAAGTGQGRTWAAIRNHLRPEEGRLRHGARRVLLPPPAGAHIGHRRTRGRRLCHRLRFPRPP